MRATAAATSKLEVSASSVRAVSSLEPKPRHQSSDGQASVALASVVPPLTDTFERFVRTRIGLEPVMIDAGSLAGTLSIEIDRPAEAGADRPQL